MHTDYIDAYDLPILPYEAGKTPTFFVNTEEEIRERLPGNKNNENISFACGYGKNGSHKNGIKSGGS